MVEEKIKVYCPRCGKSVRWKGNLYRPFCSQRCKLIDLGKWIDGEFCIQGEKILSDEEEGEGGDINAM
jgi:endogenous inhibitor of DNA gyrase (YacG/DUF329 family)